MFLVFLAFFFSKKRKCKLDFHSQGDQRAPELRRAAEERERWLGEMTTSQLPINLSTSSTLAALCGTVLTYLFTYYALNNFRNYFPVLDWKLHLFIRTGVLPIDLEKVQNFEKSTIRLAFT